MTRAKTLLAVGLGTGFLLRIWGFQQGYPEFYGHVDEIGVAASVWNFYRSATLLPTEFTYPAFYSYLNAAGLWVSYWFGFLSDVGDARESIIFTSYADPACSALIGRIISALAATLTVLMTYLLARRACTPQVAVVALVFAAVAAVPTGVAHNALPDSSMAFFAALSFYLSWRIFESGRWRYYALGGASAGLLVATKYNGGLVALSLVCAFLLHQRSGGIPRSPWQRLPKLLLCVAVAFLTLFVASPYLLLAHDKYLALGRYQVSSLSFSLGETTPWWWVIQGLVEAEFLLGILSVVAIGVALWRRTPLDWIFLAAWIPSFLYIGSWTRESLHYLVQFYPLLSILAASIFCQLLRRFLPLVHRSWLLGPAALLFMLPNLLTVVAENRRRELPDTRELAAEWIAANVPSGSTIAMTWLPYCPRLRLQQASAGILRSYAREDHLRQRLLEQWRGQPAYRLVNMEVWLKKPWVPEPLRAEVDLGDPESARVFRRAWLSLGQLKSKGVQYIVLPAAVYQRYLGSGEPPEHGAARFHYLKNRAYFEQFLKPDESKIAPQFSVEAGATSRGGSIRVFRII